MARTFGPGDAVRYAVVGLIGYATYEASLKGKLGKSMQTLALEIEDVLLSDEQKAERAAKRVMELAAEGAATASAASTTAGKQAGNSTPAARAPNVQDLPGLTDFDGLPVVFDRDRRTLRQDPRLGGTNIYKPGDVFQFSGRWVQYTGGLAFVWMDTGRAFSWDDVA